MSKILVTGGCGYIGSHTIVDLVENGYEVISVDNNSRSNQNVLLGIELITGKKIKNYKVDLCNFDDTYAIFQENEDISGIIHFAAYKSVGESVENPLLYFENNLTSLTNLLKCVQEFHTPYFVFSSSCSVYGNRDYIHVCDLASAHTLSLKYLEQGKNAGLCEVFNLGTGNGITVLEAIHAFEKVSGIKLNYEIGPRRPGDVIAVYANYDLAKKLLGWDPEFSLDDIMETAWKWELRLKADETVFSGQPPELN